MAEPFVGEIRLAGFPFAPRGWALCNGQTLPIAQNAALFSLLGATYGGDGVNTFALPDLRGRIPMHFGNGFTQGQSGGEASHALTTAEMPSHSHSPRASAVNGVGFTPVNAEWAAHPTLRAYSSAAPNVDLAGGTAVAGSGQAHENLAPYQVVNFIIALTGIFPSRP